MGLFDDLMPAGSDGGGNVDTLTMPDAANGQRTHRWPEVLPGGKAVLFLIGKLTSPGYHDDCEIAVQLIDVRRPKYPDVIFGMEVLLKLNKLKEAQMLASHCAKALRSTTDRFEQSVRLTGLGEYYSGIQRWDDALAAWEHMPLEQPFRRDALNGIVKIHLARALHAATRGLQLLSELKKNPDKEIQLIAPGNDLALMLDAEKELLKFKRGIEKILREKVRKDLGIPIQSDHQNAKSTPTA